MHVPCIRIVHLQAVGLLAALVASVAPLAASAEDAASGGATTERVVVDQTTGFAIGGFDAVAFFLDRRPVDGAREFEASYDGAIWRFANKGNRDAFVEAPDLYAPQYGGHCARSAAIGIPAEADPRIFAVYRGRLYFFRGEGERALWYAAPADHIAAADENWPHLVKLLAR